jgi:hypothetical protein
VPEFTGVIEQPGLYPGIDEAVYHRDPVAHEWGSLSVSAAKLLVPPAPAAKFDWARKHGRLPSKAQKLGTLAHALTLGQPTGPIAVLDFENRTRTKKFMAEEEKALKAGLQVVLRKEMDEAQAIADAVHANKTAAGLLNGADCEVSGFWVDGEFGIWQRMRIDAFTLAYAMPTIVDLKTSKDASEEGFAKSVAEYGYHRQDVHYRQGLAACLKLKDWRDVDFVFVVVESEPPYLVAVYRVSDGSPDEHGDLTPDDVGLGLEQLQAARERFRGCSESGIWPGYSEEIERLELPRYKRQAMERDINEWFD